MKALTKIVKILTVLAAVAGAVYVIATYGEQIVAWAKKVLASFPKCPSCCESAPQAQEVPVAQAVSEEAVEEAPAAVEVPAEEAAVETPVPEILVSENEPVADEADFAE